MDFYSHWNSDPEKRIKLEEHLRQVGDASKEIILTLQLNNIDKNIVAEVAYLIGISHDFGKFTTFFQDKLKGISYKNDALSNHSLISALFVFRVLSQYTKEKNLDGELPYKFLPLMGYFVVKHHHGNLKDINDDVNPEKLFKIGFKSIAGQFKNIQENKAHIINVYTILLKNYVVQIEHLFSSLDAYKQGVNSSDEIELLVGDLDEQFYFFNKESKHSMVYYFIVQLLYSTLIDSDKKHAGSIIKIERKELSDCLVETHIKKDDFKKENATNIDSIRNNIQRSVISNLTSRDCLQKKIFTLTAPTGTGKTLTSLYVALKLRRILKNDLNLVHEPRIIYSLPFTSIIDQNYDVFEQVLNQIPDFKMNESQYLLKHHYLSDVFYKTSEIDKDEDISQSLALIEAWESEIIVTTFIQLFYSIIGYKNRSLKKFHNIANSIIILDEIQNIPIKYWELVRKVLIGMTEFLNCRIILMTATKPLIFNEDEYKELVDDHEKYFESKQLNRVCLRTDKSKKEITDFCNELTDWSKKSYLFVFNTIGSSLDFYKLMKCKNEKLGLNFKITYLSTNIIPRDRREKIESLKKAIRSGQKTIIVSTQMIEAGVDIDCDCVYRDMGPLDSIIQVAGRCNRNKRLDRAEMHLVNLIKEDGDSFTNIYDSVLLNIVHNLLQNKANVDECDFLELINSYFEQAKLKSRIQTSIINSMYELYFYDKNPDQNKRIPVSDFKLIDEDFYTVDIFIEIDVTATEVKKRYCEILAIQDPIERKMEFMKIKKQFYDYVISVPKNYAIGFKEDELGYVNSCELESYYDKETGFKRENAGCGTVLC